MKLQTPPRPNRQTPPSPSVSARADRGRQRHAIGILALVLLVTGGVLALVPYFVIIEGSGLVQCMSISLRLAFVLGMWWLAYPEIRRLPGWLWWAVPTLLLLVVFRILRLRWLALLIPVLIVLAMLKPRSRRPR